MEFPLCKGCYKRYSHTSTELTGVSLCHNCIRKLKQITEKLIGLR